MNDAALDPSEGAQMQVQPPVPARLVATGEPAAAVVEALLGALHKGEITSKLAREVLVRALPPSKRTVRVPLPKVVDAESYAAATQRILKAAAAGKIAPADAVVMMRATKGAYEAVRAAERARLLRR